MENGTLFYNFIINLRKYFLQNNEKKKEREQYLIIVNLLATVFRNYSIKWLHYRSEYNDWLPGLANMLQPIPIHVRSLSSEYFVK